jgi:hypothetical protein
MVCVYFLPILFSLVFVMLAAGAWSRCVETVPPSPADICEPSLFVADIVAAQSITQKGSGEPLTNDLG